MIEEYVHFYSDKLRLEGVLTYNEDVKPFSAILLCNPHPNLGGDMDNNVIGSLAHISAQMGFASLRFNYRGVGNSESYQKDTAGKFLYWEASLSGENYMDAVHDTRAALHFLAEQNIGSRIYIAGYSFGALVGMRVGVESEMIAAFASISMPFGKYNLDFLAPCKKPKLIVYTQNDFATTEEDTLRCFSKILPPKQLELIQDSDHFYRMKEEMVSKKVCSFFQSIGKNEFEKE